MFSFRISYGAQKVMVNDSLHVLSFSIYTRDTTRSKLETQMITLDRSHVACQNLLLLVPSLTTTTNRCRKNGRQC